MKFNYIPNFENVIIYIWLTIAFESIMETVNLFYFYPEDTPKVPNP